MKGCMERMTINNKCLLCGIRNKAALELHVLRRTWSFFGLFALLLVAMLCTGISPAQAELKAGAAKVSITPDVMAMSVPLGGYAARRGAPATGVHDLVYARALMLQNGAVKVAVVSLDLCFLPTNVKDEVMKRVMAGGVNGMDTAHLFLSATHTHSAPDPLAMHSGNTFTNLKGWTPFNPKLLDFTAGKIAEAVIAADKNLTPATIGSTVKNAVGLNRNRRGDPTVDPALTVVAVQKIDGSPLATVVNFAAHPTLYDDKMLQISADWPGVMAADVESVTGNTPCLFLNGAEGDASPNGVDDAKGDAKVTVYGHKMSAFVNSMLPTLTMEANDSTTLATWTTEVTLPPRKANAMFYLAAGQLGATIAQAKEFVTGLMPASTQFTFVRIGSLLLIGFPCEPSGDIGLAAEVAARKAGYAMPCVVALTNGWLAYCLTPMQYKAGKYEAVMSFYGDGFGPALLTALDTGLTQGGKQR